jgi:3-oxoacyl-[acyl-carrier-protein] synthase-3
MAHGCSRIIGTGAALPERAVSNGELARQLAERGIETSDEWIVARTGIRQRYIADASLTTTELGTRAARAYGLAVADSMIRTGVYRRALVIGAEVFSRILDWNDRTTCVLFGDGAGAVVLEAAERPGILAARLHADGTQARILCTAGRVAQGAVHGDPFLRMDGQAVFRLAVNVLDSSAREVLADAHLGVDAVDWLIPHQANVRILSATARKLGLPESKVIVTVDLHGNTSAASVPLALDLAVRDGRVRAGQHVLLQGVGGGFTWGSVLLRF